MKVNFIVVLISLSITFKLFAQTTVTTSSVELAINPSLLSLNGRSTEGPSWSDTGFLSLVSEMKPAFVRYPGGTLGNQWNWQTGLFLPGVSGNTSFPFTIPMFVSRLPQNTKIIFMVNMVLPTPQTGITYTTTTDAVLKTDATLNAKITDILNAIKEFQNSGHLPDVVELGNELYFSNTEAGVYANDPVFYLSHAKKIAAAIRNLYPQIKIILCTTKGGTTSRDNWNNTVFNTLKSDQTFKSYVQGVVQHHYINAAYGYQGVVSDIVTSKSTIAEGVQYAQDIISDYSAVPNDLKLWITEFGATKTTSDAMWVSGLRTATMTLSMMQLGSKIENLTWHHVTDDPNIIDKSLLKLGPSGLAFSLMSQALWNKSISQKLVFSNMNSADPFATLFGYKFRGNNQESVIIVNYDNVTYTGVNLSNLFQGTQVSFAKQYWTATPYTTPVYAGNNINTVSSTKISSYKINPFSITTIIVDSTLTDLISPAKLPDFKVFFNKILNRLSIDDAKSDGSLHLSISDLNGRILQNCSFQSSNIDLSLEFLQSGVYILRVENDRGKYVGKIVKTH